MDNIREEITKILNKNKINFEKLVLTCVEDRYEINIKVGNKNYYDMLGIKITNKQILGERIKNLIKIMKCYYRYYIKDIVKIRIKGFLKKRKKINITKECIDCKHWKYDIKTLENDR